MEKFDVIIVGAGPAGLTAALYCARSKLNTLCIERQTAGGQAAITEEIENYPGFPDGISGPALGELMKKQAERFGAHIIKASVDGVEISGDEKIIQIGGTGKYICKALIIASGSSIRPLGCQGEEKLRSRGVSYCATCDGAFFEETDIAVVGGGDSAVEEAIYLTRFADKVTIIHRRDTLRASKILQERAIKNPKIEFAWNTVVDEIVGTDAVESLSLKNVVTGELRELPVSGVFIFAGTTPNSAFLNGLVQTDEKGYIITDEDMRTNSAGIFAAGDVRVKTLRQVCTAAADGAAAAVQAEKYIEHSI